jgi:hypothetical protein
VELLHSLITTQKWKETLSIAAAEPTGWGSSISRLKKMTPPVKKVKGNVSSILAMEGVAGSVTSTTEGMKGMKCWFAGSLGCSSMRPVHRCSLFGDLLPEEAEKIF